MIDSYDYFKNSPSLNVNKFFSIESEAFHYGVTDTKTGISGFGGDYGNLNAQKKAVFELIERTVFRFKAKDSTTSSGWAAHSSIEQAKKNAQFELIERDAILCSWLLKIPPMMVRYVKFTLFSDFFPVLQFGEGKNFFVLGVVLELNKKRIFLSVVSHCIESGIQKLKVDSERAFFILNDSSSIEDSIFSAHHENFCSLSKRQIEWMFLDGKGIKYDFFPTEYCIFEVPLWTTEVAWVVKATSHFLQALYYGNTQKEVINFSRLAELGYHTENSLNLETHPFL